MIDIKCEGDIFIALDISLKEALTVKRSFEEGPGIKYRPFLLYKTPIGYYAGWDCINGNSIYCGTRSESISLKQIKDYAKEHSL
jgi:hypothetical protein